jgi:hypothetical protein
MTWPMQRLSAFPEPTLCSCSLVTTVQWNSFGSVSYTQLSCTALHRQTHRSFMMKTEKVGDGRAVPPDVLDFGDPMLRLQAVAELPRARLVWKVYHASTPIRVDVRPTATNFISRQSARTNRSSAEIFRIRWFRH